MGSIGRSAALILILMMFVSSLTLIGVNPLAKAQTGTSVSSQIITQNTTWTKAGSPYTLMGPVGVASGVTLTIDAGVTVNLGSTALNELNVNGTLNAQGSSTDNIIFTNNAPNNAPDIIFDENSRGIIENAVFNNPSIQSLNGASMIINNCVFKDGSGISSLGEDSPATITNNYVSGAVAAEDATVSNNTILQGITIPADPGSTSMISGNNITNPGGTVVLLYWEATISGNIILSGSDGIVTNGGDTIQRNLIINNEIGISLDPIYSAGIIENNTIVNNSGGGILYANGAETIRYNNLENNGEYDLVGSRYAVNATYNWWGTADTQAINQTIDDNKNDYNLGVVAFVPFLTSPNSQAPAITTPIPSLILSTPAPTSSPSKSSSQSPSQSSQGSPSESATQPEFNWLEIAMTATLILIVALLSVIIVLLLRRRPQKTATSP